jgi:hypothetical protein
MNRLLCYLCAGERLNPAISVNHALLKSATCIASIMLWGSILTRASIPEHWIVDFGFSDQTSAFGRQRDSKVRRVG